MITVLVLGGGPDAEREVSLNSAGAIAEALRAGGKFGVEHRVIDRIGEGELRALPGDVVFPALHGPFGEGGPLQDLLEAGARPYVGCGPGIARLAMDKMATKMAAACAAIPTPESCVINVKDDVLPIAPPAVVKPVHDGSSVGLHIIRCEGCWKGARAAVREDVAAHPGGGRVYMAERFIAGRELTVGLLDGEPLPIVQIIPAEGPYDYEAKYTRDDTRYVVNPDLPAGVGERVRRDAVTLARALGVRHLARVDFILDGRGRHWLLEINTMPGFTSHSLVPMAARSIGLEMPDLCQRLVELALRDGVPNAADASAGRAAAG
ncbi:MAG: D-alanine--D-alanine ligase [Phycisphaerales bacterium]